MITRASLSKDIFLSSLSLPSLPPLLPDLLLTEPVITLFFGLQLAEVEVPESEGFFGGFLGGTFSFGGQSVAEESGAEHDEV